MYAHPPFELRSGKVAPIFHIDFGPRSCEAKGGEGLLCLGFRVPGFRCSLQLQGLRSLGVCSLRAVG